MATPIVPRLSESLWLIRENATYTCLKIDFSTKKNLTQNSGSWYIVWSRRNRVRNLSLAVSATKGPFVVKKN